MSRELYDNFISKFSKVRDLYHSVGKISDANQKLEEYVKLFSVHYGVRVGIISKINFAELNEPDTFSVSRLNYAFQKVASSDKFQFSDGTPIFGYAPKLNLDTDEAALCYAIFISLKEIGELAPALHAKNDFISTFFGLFVRDNFRNHIEDAQYMTPPEVVEFMCELGLFLTKRNDDLRVCDPTCGVGSFLSAFANNAHVKDIKLKLIGQDKSHRMTMLTAFNAIFSDIANFEVFTGNTVYDKSDLAKYSGKIDLILTNPPFSAKISKDDLEKRSKKSLPFFSSQKPLPKHVDSEIAFLDRYMELLSPGGVCLVVLPEGALSGGGLSHLIRKYLIQNSELLAVINLPSTTFALAGTRTKTCIVVFRKHENTKDIVASETLFGNVKSLGFDLATRKGVPKKIKLKTENQLPSLLESFISKYPLNNISAFKSNFVEDDWSPAKQIIGTQTVGSGSNIKISDVVFAKVKKKSANYEEGKVFISVLHVVSIVQLDYMELYSYKPITAGQVVEPGEVLVSRINPRIPRVLVVPDFGVPTLCSAEFEILKPLDNICPYKLAFWLIQPDTWSQIEALATGTSSSHARIKREQIYDIRLSNDFFTKAVDKKLKRFKSAIKSINEAGHEIAKMIEIQRK